VTSTFVRKQCPSAVYGLNCIANSIIVVLSVHSTAAGGHNGWKPIIAPYNRCINFLVTTACNCQFNFFGLYGLKNHCYS